MTDRTRITRGRIDSAAPSVSAPLVLGGRSCPRFAAHSARAFTLVELLVVVAVVALLVAVLVPALAGAKSQARQAVCASNLRQMTLGTFMYTNQSRGSMLPCGWKNGQAEGYWWGEIREGLVDYSVSPLYPYLRGELEADSVYECPDQPWGTYEPQGLKAPNRPTSTYGYNGYYLTPAATPGWKASIGKRPWQRLETIPTPGQVFVFADTLIYFPAQGKLYNDALLDPPFIVQSFARPGTQYTTRWRPNDTPTTAFRHRGKANAACADGHVDSFDLEGGQMVSPRHNIGSVGETNGPHYVPDWKDW